MADCFLNDSRVCQSGKTQRVLIAVIQGRLPGVQIDRECEYSLNQAVSLFCNVHKDKTKEQFLHQANIFKMQLREEIRQGFQDQINDFVDLNFD